MGSGRHPEETLFSLGRVALLFAFLKLSCTPVEAGRRVGGMACLRSSPSGIAPANRPATGETMARAELNASNWRPADEAGWLR